MPDFRRPHHGNIAVLLGSLDAAFLLRARCYFGGGSAVSLLLDEFRESRDVDFLCSDRGGFRALRETIRDRSLGRIQRKPLALAREVRADREAIRTFVLPGEVPIKFEIVLEARLDLAGRMDRRLGVPVLDLDCLVAEKLLANADRGLDDASHSRDLIDLAFLGARRGREPLRAGLALAESAYGAAVRRGLARALARTTGRRGRLAACARALGVQDTRTLRRGIVLLRRL